MAAPPRLTLLRPNKGVGRVAPARVNCPGFVSLVGAGPGDPDLITVRGLKCLRGADVVLHDALIPPELLAEARADAELVHVGKRGYCVGSTTQEDIHSLMVR